MPFEEKNVRLTVLIPEKSTEQFSGVINSFMDSNQMRSVIQPFN